MLHNNDDNNHNNSEFFVFGLGVPINPASMKQALTASAVRLPDANMFEQGKV